MVADTIKQPKTSYQLLSDRYDALESSYLELQMQHQQLLDEHEELYLAYQELLHKNSVQIVEEEEPFVQSAVTVPHSQYGLPSLDQSDEQVQNSHEETLLVNSNTNLPLYGDTELVHPGNTKEEREAWFNSGDGYVYPHQRHGYYYRIILDPEQRSWYMRERVQEINATIERLIIFRSIPGYKKNVGKTNRMVVSMMDVELWDDWLKSQSVEPNFRRIKKFSYQDHGFRRPAESIQVGWTNGVLPNLNTEFWYMLKWCTPSGKLHRALVNDLIFRRNSWTGIVDVQFYYETWFYDDNVDGWKEI